MYTIPVEAGTEVIQPESAHKLQISEEGLDEFLMDTHLRCYEIQYHGKKRSAFVHTQGRTTGLDLDWVGGRLKIRSSALAEITRRITALSTVFSGIVIEEPVTIATHTFPVIGKVSIVQLPFELYYAKTFFLSDFTGDITTEYDETKPDPEEDSMRSILSKMLTARLGGDDEEEPTLEEKVGKMVSSFAFGMSMYAHMNPSPETRQIEMAKRHRVVLTCVTSESIEGATHYPVQLKYSAGELDVAGVTRTIVSLIEKTKEFFISEGYEEGMDHSHDCLHVAYALRSYGTPIGVETEEDCTNGVVKVHFYKK